MSFNKNTELDERQLIIRGNIFKHGLFIVASLILINSLLFTHLSFQWASDRWAELTIILFTIVVCCVEFICYDIYPLAKNKMKFAIYLMGLVGIVSIVVCAYELIAENSRVLIDGVLNNNILGIFHGCLFLSIPIAHIAKETHNSKHEMEGD